MSGLPDAATVTVPEFSVVIPLFNEVENVAILQRELWQALAGRSYELILVDDGSTDGTCDKIMTGPEVRLLRFEENRGQSAAMLAGIGAARAPVVVLLDGDLQNDPADIPAMLRMLGDKADLVCGYRAHRQDTFSKKLTSRIANFVRSRFIGDGVRDTGCTLKAMKRECAAALVPFRGVHRFIPALVKNAGYRVVETPVNHRPRRFGVSKYGLGNRAWRATMDMFGVRWLMSRRLPAQPAAGEAGLSQK